MGHGRARAIFGRALEKGRWDMVSRVFLAVVAVSLAAVGLGNPIPSSGPYLVTPCDLCSHLVQTQSPPQSY